MEKQRFWPPKNQIIYQKTLSTCRFWGPMVFRVPGYTATGEGGLQLIHTRVDGIRWQAGKYAILPVKTW